MHDRFDELGARCADLWDPPHDGEPLMVTACRAHLASLIASQAREAFGAGGGAGCYDCGRPYGDEHGFPDFIIQGYLWARISPTGDDGGLLCPSCICGRLHRAGISGVYGAFTSGPIESVARPTIEALRRAENLCEQIDRPLPDAAAEGAAMGSDRSRFTMTCYDPASYPAPIGVTRQGKIFAHIIGRERDGLPAAVCNTWSPLTPCKYTGVQWKICPTCISAYRRRLREKAP